MFVLGEFFNALAFFVNTISQILIWLLVGRIVVTWLPVDPYHGIVVFLTQVTDPILRPFRRIPLRIGMLDLTPILAFMAIYFLRDVLIRVLAHLAYQFGA